MTEVKVVQSGAVPIAAKLCRIANIAQTINHMVHWKEENSKVSPGLLIESLIICILCNRKPLWKVHQFWVEQDLASVFAGVDLTPDQLNDDAYGRALDKLSEINEKELVGTINLTMLAAHGLDIDFVHFDTTSKSVQGDFEGEAPKDFDVTRGYSKDKRPDLKQLKFGLGVQQSGLPLMGELLSGNKLDVHWNPEAVVEMHDWFASKGYKDVIFVSDCALISVEGLQNLLKNNRNIQFISRLPETFSLAEEVKTLAWERDEWTHVGSFSDKKEAACYKTFSVLRDLEGVTYRFVAVHSSALETLKEKTIQKSIAKKKESLEKHAKKLGKATFACEPDAQAALDELLQLAEKECFTTTAKVYSTETKSYPGRGKPKAGQEPIITISYHIECTIGEVTPQELKRLRKMESTFVLITTLKDSVQYDDAAVLKEYKNQNTVETKFRVLKNPVYLGPVYLKSKKRIKAMGYVFLLVLMLACYLEYRVRKNMEENGEYLLQPGNKKNNKPAVTTIMEVLESLSVVIVNGVRMFPKNVNKQALKMIEWAGFDIQETYLKPLVAIH